jgi:hypothetical protein
MLTGTVGGVMGAIASVIGVTWSILNVSFLTDSVIYSYLTLFQFKLTHAFTVGFIPPSSSYLLFNIFSIILAIFLIVTGILIGVGFYGFHSSGEGVMGVVYLIFSIIGNVIGALLIFLGIIYANTVYIYNFTSPPGLPPISYTLLPNYVSIWIGMMVLAVTLILLGSASINVRKKTAHSSTAAAAGSLSIIGACFFFPYILGILGGILLLIGFSLVFLTFILWTAVFYSSGQISISRKEEAIPAIKTKVNHTLRPIVLNCLYCGSEIPKNAKVCPSCGAARVMCPVCNLDIVFGDLFIKCPFCGILSHRDHLLEWIKIRGTCPNCKKKLSETEIS